MKKVCLTGLLVAWGCTGLQVQSPSEVQAALMADLRGDEDKPPKSEVPRRNPHLLPAIDGSLANGLPPREKIPNAGAAVSVTHLKHKVPNAAAKALNRAQVFRGRQDHEMAAREMERALELDPENSDVRVDLGVEYAVLMRFREAETQFSRSIAIDPSYSGYYNLSLVLFQIGELTEAENSVRHALALDPSKAMAHLLLAHLLMTVPEKHEEFRLHLRYAAQTIPEASEMLNKLSEQSAEGVQQTR
jgi:tetratricopeptide (TPR) repeat protein